MVTKIKKDPRETAQDLVATMDRIELLLEQTNQLYQQFLLGVQDRPPVEKRSLLNAEIKKLEGGRRATALRFRVQSVISRFSAFSERWDRTMRDLESGKIQRKTRGSGKKSA